MALQEIPLAAAAAHLGLSPDAVRLRVQRGKTLQGGQRDGAWYVLLDPDALADAARRNGDASPTDPDVSSLHSDASATLPDASDAPLRLAVAEALNAALTAERDRLVEQLAAAEIERAELRRLLALALQRPALPAPRESDEQPPSRPPVDHRLWWERWLWWRR